MGTVLTSKPLLRVLMLVLFVLYEFSLSASSVGFIENKGQWQSNVAFRASLGTGQIYLEKNQLTFCFQNEEDLHEAHELHHLGDHNGLERHIINNHAYNIRFVGAKTPKFVRNDERPEFYNFYHGKDQLKWASNVKAYNEITLSGLYQNIDLVAYSLNGNFKYDYIVKAGANASDIQLSYSGLDSLYIHEEQLILKNSVGELFEEKPYAYQIINGKEVVIPCIFVLDKGVMSFDFPNGYNRNYDLIIDPTLIGATLSGTAFAGENWGCTSSYDDNGNIYTGSIAFAAGYPTTFGAFQTFWAGQTDMGISKLNDDGTTLIYATYLGGSGYEFPESMYVHNDELYVLGASSSNNYPVFWTSYDYTFNGGTDIVVSKFNIAGSNLLASTFVGGADFDGLNGIYTGANGTPAYYPNYGDSYRGEIIVDANGDCFIASNSSSNDFPTSAGAFQTNYLANQMGVVFKLNATLTNLNWATYVGAWGDDAAYGLHLDVNGDLYVTGMTSGNTFTGATGYQSWYQGGLMDGYVLHLSGNGTTELGSTYWGTGDREQSFFVDLDDQDNVYIFGQCEGGNTPITPGKYSQANSTQFVAKFDPTLQNLEWSTRIGGSNGGNWKPSFYGLSPIAFLVDQCGGIYLSGHNAVSGLPTSPGAFQTNGGFYLLTLEKDANAMSFATYYGGLQDHVDGGTSRFDRNGYVYQAVCTNGGFNTTPGAWSSNYPNNYDVGVFKIHFEYDTAKALFNVNPDVIGCAPLNAAFTNTSTGTDYIWDYGDGSPLDTIFQSSHVFTTPGNYTTSLIAIDSTGCVTRDTVKVNIVVGDPNLPQVSFKDSVDCYNNLMMISGVANPTPNVVYNWDMGNGVTFLDSTNFTYTYPTPGTYTITVVGQDTVCNLTTTFSSTISIGSPVYNIVSIDVCPGEPYIYNSITYTTVGPHQDTLVAQNGCDSVVTFSFNVLPHPTKNVTVDVCPGEPLTYLGKTYPNVGPHQDTIAATAGCDTLVDVTFNVLPHPTKNVTVDVCPGEPFTYLGKTYPNVGPHQDTIAATGCDTLVDVTFNVLPHPTKNVTVDVCPGEPFTYLGKTYPNVGPHQDTIAATTGCDTLVDVTFNVLPHPTKNVTVDVCPGEPFTYLGKTYPSVGPHQDTIVATTGCDTLVDVTFNVLPHPTKNVTIDVCPGEPFTYLGKTYPNVGPHQDTIAATTGCDTLVDVTFNVLPHPTKNVTVDVCPGEPFTYLGKTYPNVGPHQDTIAATTACDTLVDVTFNVLPHPTKNVTVDVCPGEPFTYLGKTYPNVGPHQDTIVATTGCDTLVDVTFNVLPHPTKNVTVDVCPGEPFTYLGKTYPNVGPHQDTIAATTGCDTLVDVTFNVLPHPTKNVTVDVCPGEPFTYLGKTYPNVGPHQDTIVATTGCDTLVDVTFNILSVSTNTINVSICPGSSYNFNGTIINTSGSFKDTLVSANGCDSIITLNVSVTTYSTDTVNAAICLGSSYPWAGGTIDSAGTYNDTLQTASGCDSIAVLILIVNPIITSNPNVSICPGSTYNFNGTIISSPGTYYDTVSTAAGCDSTITLNVIISTYSTDTVNAAICLGASYSWAGGTVDSAGTYNDTLQTAAGCDSIAVLILTVNPILTSNPNVSICPGSTYNFNGTIINSPGTYYDTVSTAAGCDSAITLNVTISTYSTDTVNAAICFGASYPWAGGTIDSAGIYNDTLQTAAGCDSISVLVLTINPIITSNPNVSICPGSTYNFNGTIIGSPGTYYDTVSTATGCDSAITLNVSLNASVSDTTLADICSGTSFNWGGSAYNTAGTYVDTFLSSSGCDSLSVLILTIQPAINHSINADICSGTSYNFNGTILTTTGTYYDSLVSSQGCDSIVTLQLVVNAVTQDSLFVGICTGNSYNFNGTVVNTPGIYYDSLTSVNGCDSVVILDLTVDNVISNNINATICAGDQYPFGVQNLSSPGIYIDSLIAQAGCDSVVTLTLSVNQPSNDTTTAQICQGSTYFFGGTNIGTQGVYVDSLNNINGCDSILVLDLTVLPQITNSISGQICSGDSILFGGIYRKIAGSFDDTLTSQSGCDSIVTLNLNVLPNSSSNINANICDGDVYSFFGSNLTVGGSYTHTIGSSNGCDSIINLTLVVISNTGVTLNQTICDEDSFYFAGDYLHLAGTYTDTVPNSNGCDSVITLVLSKSAPVGSYFGVTICSGASYSFGNNVYSASGLYFDTLPSSAGCDSVVTLKLDVSPVIQAQVGASVCQGGYYVFANDTLTASGEYQHRFTTHGGCDSLVTLTLDVEPIYGLEVDTVLCFGEIIEFDNEEVNSGGTYYETMKTVDGQCDSIAVYHVDYRPCEKKEGNLYIANTFTPNGNGINDRYFPLAIELTTMKFWIFNRWGDLLFFTDDVNGSWDGKYKGVFVKQDVYVWKIEYTIAGGREQKQFGHVNVLY
ncbi:MAG: PKD domain-containing protein [Flavobacteriales bacterium]|nr:PKD domain-containing protein [Flavobacteriales bacterium]